AHPTADSAAGPTADSAAGPTADSAAGPASVRASALVRHLVAEMIFPPGSKPASLRSVPRALRDPGPGGKGWARAERLLLAPAGPAAVWAAVLPHPPFNDQATMGAAAVNGPVGNSTLMAAPEAGIDAAVVAVWAEPWSHGTTLIAAYAFATALPVRTAAEHLDPGRFRAVTLSARELTPPQRTTTRTFASAAVIARLAAYLNGRPATPPLAVSCPALLASYQVTFIPKQGGDPAVTAEPGCMADRIDVGGVPQPLVWDSGGRLADMIRQLLGR
ncbi:MAG: hypothetical protein ACRDPF_31690, partial [Streptosporangiaceae bacterium]